MINSARREQKKEDKSGAAAENKPELHVQKGDNVHSRNYKSGFTFELLESPVRLMKRIGLKCFPSQAEV